MTKKTIKRWFFYKLRKMMVICRRKFKRAMKTMDPNVKISLNEIQKPLYDICMKLINDRKTELRTNHIDYVFHIENDKYLIIIRPNNTSNTELYSVSLLEYKSDGKDLSGFVDIPFPAEYTKMIIHRFDKEVQKRMKTRQVLKTVKVASHLQTILEEMS
jgi:hypothetical protein